MDHMYEIRFCHNKDDADSFTVFYEWAKSLEELTTLVKEAKADGFYGNVGYLHSIVQIDSIAAQGGLHAYQSYHRR